MPAKRKRPVVARTSAKKRSKRDPEPTAPTDSNQDLPVPQPMTDDQLREAVIQMLQRDQAREAEAGQRLERAEKLEEETKLRLAQEKKEAAEGLRIQMMKSVEVIKWCQLSISAVMAVALVIMILTVKEVDREAKRIKAEVTEVQQEAERIYEKIRNPIELVGSFLSWQLRDSLKSKESQKNDANE